MDTKTVLHIMQIIKDKMDKLQDYYEISIEDGLGNADEYYHQSKILKELYLEIKTDEIIRMEDKEIFGE
jgi:hypothetical protein